MSEASWHAGDDSSHGVDHGHEEVTADDSSSIYPPSYHASHDGIVSDEEVTTSTHVIFAAEEKGPQGTGRLTNILEAIHPQTLDSPSKLNFQRGDVVKVLNRDDNGWWRVRKKSDDTAGLVPINLFKNYIPDTADWGNTLEAVHGWSSDYPADLEFERGDVVRVVDKHQEGWWWVRRERDSQSGLVPVNCFIPLNPIERPSLAASKSSDVHSDDVASRRQSRLSSSSSSGSSIYAPPSEFLPDYPPSDFGNASGGLERPPDDARVDRLGDELAGDSDVWPTYIKTATAYDEDMVEGWNKSIDVLLLFASLFSAIVTTFVVQSSTLLEPDYNQIGALLSAHILAAALPNGSDMSFASSLPSPADILHFETSLSAEAINIIWFTALGFSLSAVLLAILAKQWLSAYMARHRMEPLLSACERQGRYDALRKWSIPHIMTLLPALLHASLFLFLAGLIIFVWQLDAKVSGATCLILGIIFVFYFASGALAVFKASCPYVTPMTLWVRSWLPKSWKRCLSQNRSDILTSRALMWLASTKDPETVKAALQSLAGLRRGYSGYDSNQAEYVAKAAFEHLRGCFIPEWKMGRYALRTEVLHEASCYSRTLINTIDDPRNAMGTFTTILNDASISTFLQQLGSCSNPSLSLLALCDYQRLLHRQEVEKAFKIRQRDSAAGSSSKQPTWRFARREPAVRNMRQILKLIDCYFSGDIFLQPYAIQVAVETIGYAPLAWVTAVSARTSPLENILSPLMRLQHLTRAGTSGVRNAMASTLKILHKSHQAVRLPDDNADFALRLETALSTIESIDQETRSDVSNREMILQALSYFTENYEKESGIVTATTMFEELCCEADRRNGAEDISDCDRVAVESLLQLLRCPALDENQKSILLTRVQSNAIASAKGYNLPQSSILFRVTPRDPFPEVTVPILIAALEGDSGHTYPYLEDASTLVFLVSRESTHRRKLLAGAQVVVDLVKESASPAVANQLFWTLTKLVHDAATSFKTERLDILASAGVVKMLEDYLEKFGITPLDVFAWIDILQTLPVRPNETIIRRQLLLSMHTHLETQGEERLLWLQGLRQPLLQFSEKPSVVHTVKTALNELKRLLDLEEYHVNSAQEMSPGIEPPAHVIINVRVDDLEDLNLS